MPDTVQIPQRDLNKIHRLMNRISIKLEKQELNDLLTEDEAAAFLEVKVSSLKNMVSYGTITREMYTTTINGARKFFKHKLIKK